MHQLLDKKFIKTSIAFYVGKLDQLMALIDSNLFDELTTDEQLLLSQQAGLIEAIIVNLKIQHGPIEPL